MSLCSCVRLMRFHVSLLSCVALVPVLLSLAFGAAASEVPLTFGQTAVFSGVNKELGTDMQNGIQTVFNQINSNGGVNGRNLLLTSLDDGYNPAPAASNVASFISSNLFATIGTVGTPTANAILAPLTAARMPLVGPFTGARSLRSPYQPYVLNIRASYDDELASLVSYSLGRGLTRFSIFYQNDTYGLAGYNALDVALKNKGLSIQSSATYERNTLAVDSGLAIMQAQLRPHVCVMIGTARALALFVTKARDTYNASSTAVGSAPGRAWTDVLFHTVSFVGSEVFAAELLAANSTIDNIVVTQVMPPPRSLAQLQADAAQFNDASLLSPTSLLYQYASAMNTYCSSCAVSFGSFEGYVTATVLVDILQRMGPITPSSVLSYILSGDFYDTTIASLPIKTAAIAYLQTNPSPFDLKDGLVIPWVRDQFLSVAYKTGLFLAGGLQLGPLQASATCRVVDSVSGSNNQSISVYHDSCLAAVDISPCNQLSYSIYMSSIELQNDTSLPSFVYRENVAARSSWSTCNINSQYLAASRRPLVFGQTAVFSGVASDLGLQMRRGIQAAFTTANISPTKGVRQRELLLISYDDGYTPDQAVANVADMANNNRVLGLIGITGTAPAKAILASGYANTLPLFGSFTGTRALRSPFTRNVINVRAGYDDELAAQVNFLLSFKSNPVIHLFRQDDSFGDAGETSLKLALSYHKLSLACKGIFVRNTVDIAAGLASLVACGVPDAIFMVGTALPLAAFVVAAEAESTFAGKGITYTTVSFVGTEAFLAALPASVASSGRIYVSEVVPPLGSSAQHIQDFPVLANFYSAMSTLNDGLPATFGALEGYLVGRLVIYAAERSLTSTASSFVDALYQSNVIDIDGLLLGPLTDVTTNSKASSLVTTTATQSCNQGSSTVYTVSLPSLSLVSQFNGGTSTSCGVLSLYSDPPCSPGYEKIYTDNSTLASKCQSCIPGYYSQDGLHCTMCAPGSFSAINGASACTPCSPSQFQDRAGQNGCLACSEHSYSGTSNATACTECEANAYTNIQGATSTSQCRCGSGYFAANNMTGLLSLRYTVVGGGARDSVWLDCQACPNSQWFQPGGQCQLPELAENTAGRGAMMALGLLGIIVSIATCILLWIWRSLPVLKAATPSLMQMISIGCVAAFLVPVIGFPFPSSTTICRTQLYLGHIAWTLMFGSSMLKCLRLRAIFLLGSKKLKKISITDAELFRYLGVMLAVQIVYLSVWQSIEPVSSTLHTTDSSKMYWCSMQSGASQIWPLLIIAYDAAILLYGVWLCVAIRSFAGAWNESKQLGVVSYNTALISTICLIAVYTLVKDENSFNLLIGVSVFLIVSMLQGVLFFYKFWQCFQAKKNAANLSHDMTSHNDGTVTMGVQAKGLKEKPSNGSDASSETGSLHLSDLDEANPYTGHVRSLHAKLADEQKKVRQLISQLNRRQIPNASPLLPGSSGGGLAISETIVLNGSPAIGAARRSPVQRRQTEDSFILDSTATTNNVLLSPSLNAASSMVKPPPLAMRGSRTTGTTYRRATGGSIVQVPGMPPVPRTNSLTRNIPSNILTGESDLIAPKSPSAVSAFAEFSAFRPTVSVHVPINQLPPLPNTVVSSKYAANDLPTENSKDGGVNTTTASTIQPSDSPISGEEAGITSPATPVLPEIPSASVTSTNEVTQIQPAITVAESQQ